MDIWLCFHFGILAVCISKLFRICYQTLETARFGLIAFPSHKLVELSSYRTQILFCDQIRMYTNKLCITISQNENTILYQIKSRFQFPPQGFLLLRNHYYSILEWLFWLTGKINDFGVAVFFTSCAWPHIFWGKPANRINDRVFLFLPWPEKPEGMVTNKIHLSVYFGGLTRSAILLWSVVRCCLL